MAGRGHRITYVCRGAADGADARAATRLLRTHDIEAIVVAEPVPRKAGWRHYARLAGNLLAPVPYSVAAHDSTQMRAALARVAEYRRRADLWQFEWPPYADMAPPAVPAARKLLNAHNVDSLIWERYYQTETNAARRWYIGRQWRKFQNYERAAF